MIHPSEAIDFCTRVGQSQVVWRGGEWAGVQFGLVQNGVVTRDNDSSQNADRVGSTRSARHRQCGRTGQGIANKHTTGVSEAFRTHCESERASAVNRGQGPR